MKDFKKIGMFSKEHGMRSHLLRILLGWKNVGFFQNWKIVLLVYTCTQNESESITRHQCD